MPDRTKDVPRQARLLPQPPEDLKPFKTPQIAVSGGVSLTELETAIIDKPDFQRLRRIKQLGPSDLVYPSAVHHRFEHSLGTLREAAVIVQKIRENPHSSAAEKEIPLEEERIIRLAALLHDVMHIPFGHTLEEETQVVTRRHDEDEGRMQHFLGATSEIGLLVIEKLGPESHQLLLCILSSKQDSIANLGQHAYMADIVGNTVCADLLDYLKRDVYFCNISEAYSDRFLNYLFLTMSPPGSGIRRLAVRLWKESAQRHRRDILSDLVNLLRMRYALGEKVYFHHAKIAASAMIARAVWSAMHPQSGNPLRLDDLYAWGDEELMAALLVSEDGVARKLATALRRRQLWKNVYALSRSEAKATEREEWPEHLEQDCHFNALDRTEEEDNLAELSGLGKGDVLIYCPPLDMALKEAEMLVTWKGEVLRLRETDDEVTKMSIESITSAHEALWRLQVFVTPEADAQTRARLHELCKETFSPPAAALNEDKIGAAFYDIVLDRMCARGGSAEQVKQVVESLSGRRASRGGTRRLTATDIDEAMGEVLGP